VIIFHTANGVVALVAGLVVILLPKGTRFHRAAGYVYAASMFVLCLASFGIRDTTPFFRGFGAFHVMAAVSLATVALGLRPALFRHRYKNWYEHHFSFMLWSYVGLIMAFNSHFFREVFLFAAKGLNLGQGAGIALSVALLWGLPPALGTLLINRRAGVYKRRFASGGDAPGRRLTAE
jgi:uncharacterized membrane protein